MLVYFAAALTALFYAFHLPVRALICARLAPGERGSLEIALGIFGRASIWVLSRPLSPAASPGQKKRRLPVSLKSAVFFYLKKHLLHFSFHAWLNLGDACLTALACGLFHAIFPFRRPLHVHPSFSGQNPMLAIRCIADIPLGHIMLAILYGIRTEVEKGVRAWIKNPLKAS